MYNDLGEILFEQELKLLALFYHGFPIPMEEGRGFQSFVKKNVDPSLLYFSF